MKIKDQIIWKLKTQIIWTFKRRNTYIVSEVITNSCPFKIFAILIFVNLFLSKLHFSNFPIYEKHVII